MRPRPSLPIIEHDKVTRTDVGRSVVVNSSGVFKVFPAKETPELHVDPEMQVFVFIHSEGHQIIVTYPDMTLIPTAPNNQP